MLSSSVSTIIEGLQGKLALVGGRQKRTEHLDTQKQGKGREKHEDNTLGTTIIDCF